ncbi:hypothetical protein AAA626_08685 [Pseudomonas aeruginosa]
MATNDFLPFAGGVGSNVLTQAAYAALSARTAGFTAGVAKSAELNKVWRQASIMSAALAQLIADNTGLDVIDDGSVATILANLKTAVGGRLIGVQTFRTPGTFTYTPTPGTKSVIVEVQGGGGGGGASVSTTTGQYSVGSAGQGGGYAKSRLTSGFSGAAVVVGAGGAGGTAGNNNSATGGTSSFGGIVSASGGSGGALGSAQTGLSIINSTGAPGAGAGGNIVNVGGGASPSTICFSATAASATPSGSAMLGGAVGPTSYQGAGSANAGLGYGGGGGGAVSKQIDTAYAGGIGAGGVVIVWEFA